MKQFILGVLVGVIGDRMLVNSVSNDEVLREVRTAIKKLDDRLAEKESPTPPSATGA